MQVKSRHHLRGDDIADVEAAVLEQLGVELDGDTYEECEFVESDMRVVLVDGEPLVAYFDGEPFLTVQGANSYPPATHVVTVDAGAVQFVSGGANVMRPGIVEADPDIEPGDLVAIAEETHGKVLAVGRADVPGSDMTGDSGKVIESLHHVGDDLFQFSV
jgi:PUA-domain protein